MRTSALQFQMLVEFMERNGDLSKPTDGPQGRAANLKRWGELVVMLNADSTGDTKALEKWRKVWSDLKNNTKKKSAKIYQAVLRTGGGPALNLSLTDLEQRVLCIIGTRAATGILEIPEVGIEGEVTEGVLETTDSPSIFDIHQQVLQQTCSNIEEWNQAGSSGQPPIFPPLERSGVPENQAAHSETARETGLTQGGEPESAVTPPAPSSRQHVQAPRSPTPASPARRTPYPPTPRRQRRRPGRPVQNQSSPAHRRTRTQTQSDLARQSFVRSDCEWRAFQQETERERTRLREQELRQQQRWMDLFQEFLTIASRIVNIFEKQ